ncbi:MAG: ATP-binding cassette domain-containing protein, partial [Ruminiclostridium sp.]|nr:ATP-binding cassette domain-containing protein [Ruminiclostridium sp.]
MIKAEKIHKFYGTGDSRSEILKGISLEIEKGSFTVILGASGSGKSTLLNVLSGLERAENGSVLYEGQDIEQLTDEQLTEFRKRKIGFIFQQYYLLPNLN